MRAETEIDDPAAAPIDELDEKSGAVDGPIYRDDSEPLKLPGGAKR
jgi:hypothetical protein